MAGFIEFTFLFAEPDEAEAFINDCAPLDYQAELQPFDGADDRWAWLVSILAPLQPGSAALTAAEVSLRSLARRHDGHYAGWA
ncbi:MAG: ribonuclease E inhibitor RraB [Chitinivorax sp.]